MKKKQVNDKVPTLAGDNKSPGRRQGKSAPKTKENGESAKAGEPLTKVEKGKLEEFEKVIGSGLTAFVEVGHALSEIKEARLYREEYKTFEDYCERQWDMSRQHGYRLIKAAQCFDVLKEGLPNGARLPRNESQLRPLEDLPFSKLVQAWKMAIGDSGGVKVTAEVVEKAVRKLAGKPSESKSAKAKKPQTRVAEQTVAKIMKVAEEALEKPKASVVELRKVLEDIRDQLKELSKRKTS